MDTSQLGPEADPTIERLLGYLNFSSGAATRSSLGNRRALRAAATDDAERRSQSTSSRTVRHHRRLASHRARLQNKLDALHESSETFKNIEQATPC